MDALRLFDKHHREIKPGSVIRSRTGDLYVLRSVELQSTPAEFGKIKVTRVHHMSPITGLPVLDTGFQVFTDFAFGLTARYGTQSSLYSG